MRWALTEEQQMLQDALRGWLDRAASPEAVRKWLESGDAGAFERSMAEEGWTAVGFAEEVGGQGGGLLESALTAEELARVAAPSSAWFSVALAAPFLPAVDVDGVLAGENSVVLAVEAGRPPDAAPRCVVADGMINGRVPRVLGADLATSFVVPATDVEGPGVYLVERDAPGVTVAAQPLLDRTRTAGAVLFADARVRRLDGSPTELPARAALRAAVLVAADTLGAMNKVLDLSVEYSKQRKQFGVPIGSFQAVKHAAATMLVDVEAARSIVYYAAASVEAGHPEAATHAAVAKAQVTGLGVKTADTALTLHGAIGYTWEHDLHLYYKRLKLNEKLFGAPSLWNERIAERLQLTP